MTSGSSANPGALLSSRLSAYLKRPCWSALSPCPLDKELTDVHPRKAYFFLTTRPRQEIPADSTDIIDASDPVKGGKRIISPSISNTSVDGDAEAAEERKREALSPSPEVDLSVHDIVTAPHETNPEFITPGTPGISFAERSSLSKRGSNNSSNGDALAHSNRAASPPLEGDEREFTQTASIVRMRGTSLDNHIARPEIRHPNETFTEETEEEKAKHNREAAEALFGPHNHASASLVMMSSPLVKPLQPTNTEAKIKKEDTDVNMQEESRTWLGDNTEELMWDASQPEDIQIEDLDDLFMAY